MSNTNTPTLLNWVKPAGLNHIEVCIANGSGVQNLLLSDTDALIMSIQIMRSIGYWPAEQYLKSTFLSQPEAKQIREIAAMLRPMFQR